MSDTTRPSSIKKESIRSLTRLTLLLTKFLTSVQDALHPVTSLWTAGSGSDELQEPQISLSFVPITKV
ncbi:hypothetical protein AVEN_254351-1, partial [Araneus ventricosus]